MRRLAKSLFLALMLASCSPTDRKPVVNRVIFPASVAPELLKQCSRDSPALGEAAWQPSEADVDRLEAMLPGALAGYHQARQVNFSDLLARWHRQYVGLVRGGRRFIYGNYFPVDERNDVILQWRKGPLMACDGGPRFFGVEFDVGARRITRIDFNGTYAGPS